MIHGHVGDRREASYITKGYPSLLFILVNDALSEVLVESGLTRGWGRRVPDTHCLNWNIRRNHPALRLMKVDSSKVAGFQCPFGPSSQSKTKITS